MPHGDDPDGPPDDAVEKPVWAHDELAIRKLREFGKDATGSRKSRQPAQPRFGSLLEPLGGWIVTNDVRPLRIRQQAIAPAKTSSRS